MSHLGISAYINQVVGKACSQKELQMQSLYHTIVGLVKICVAQLSTVSMGFLYSSHKEIGKSQDGKRVRIVSTHNLL